MKYEVKYSALGRAGIWAFLAIILCWLIIPLIIWIVYCFDVAHDKVIIEDNKVTQYEGVFAKSQTEAVMTSILSVSVSKTLMGGIFNYGNVEVNSVGNHCDLRLYNVKNPDGLKEFLSKYQESKKNEIKEFVSE